MKKILFLALLILTNHAFSFSPSDDPSLEVIDKVKPFTVYLDTKFSKLSTDKSGIVQAALLVEHNYTEETNNEAISGRTHQKLSNEPRYRSPFIGDLTRGTF